MEKKISLVRALTFVCCGFMLGSANLHAHGRWLVPSHTILSGDKPEAISLDFSISNDFFHPDMPYGGKDIAGLNTKPNTKDTKALTRYQLMQRQFASTRLVSVDPQGNINNKHPIVNLGRKSASAILLAESGTYKLSIKQAPTLMTVFLTESGEKGREFGSFNDVETLLPKGAKEVKTFRVMSSVETYVTRNNLTKKTLLPLGKGLELVHSNTHPNELFVGESSRYQLMVNGKPASAGVELKLTRNDTRYRNQRNTIKPITNNKGEFSVDWTQAGLYLLEAEMTLPSSEEGIDLDIFSLYVTLEVNPE